MVFPRVIDSGGRVVAELPGFTIDPAKKHQITAAEQWSLPEELKAQLDKLDEICSDQIFSLLDQMIEIVDAWNLRLVLADGSIVPICSLMGGDGTYWFEIADAPIQSPQITNSEGDLIALLGRPVFHGAGFLAPVLEDRFPEPLRRLLEEKSSNPPTDSGLLKELQAQIDGWDLRYVASTGWVRTLDMLNLSAAGECFFRPLDLIC